jgi:homoserine kinase
MKPHQPSGVPTSVRAFAPGGIGNIGPGLDILGCALTGPGDRVTAIRIPEVGVRLDDPGHRDLPTDPAKHAAAIAASEVLRRAGAVSFGVSLVVEKGLPLSGGQGGSSASAVAGAVAVNAMLGQPLGSDELLLAALAAEEKVAGRHLDNIAPAMLGGILLIRSTEPPDVVRLPVPAQLRVVLVHPSQQLRTAEARAVLPPTIDRTTAFAQAADVAAMVSAFHSGDFDLIRRALNDRIAEPARAPLLPGFAEAKRAALDAGAFGCSISGAGPTAFAFADSDSLADRIATAMKAAYAARGVDSSARVARIDEQGARVEVLSERAAAASDARAHDARR